MRHNGNAQETTALVGGLAFVQLRPSLSIRKAPRPGEWEELLDSARGLFQDGQAVGESRMKSW